MNDALNRESLKRLTLNFGGGRILTDESSLLLVKLFLPFKDYLSHAKTLDALSGRVREHPGCDSAIMELAISVISSNRPVRECINALVERLVKSVIVQTIGHVHPPRGENLDSKITPHTKIGIHDIYVTLYTNPSMFQMFQSQLPPKSMVIFVSRLSIEDPYFQMYASRGRPLTKGQIESLLKLHTLGHSHQGVVFEALCSVLESTNQALRVADPIYYGDLMSLFPITCIDGDLRVRFETGLLMTICRRLTKIANPQTKRITYQNLCDAILNNPEFPILRALMFVSAENRPPAPRVSIVKMHQSPPRAPIVKMPQGPQVFVEQPRIASPRTPPRIASPRTPPRIASPRTPPRVSSPQSPPRIALPRTPLHSAGSPSDMRVFPNGVPPKAPLVRSPDYTRTRRSPPNSPPPTDPLAGRAGDPTMPSLAERGGFTGGDGNPISSGEAASPISRKPRTLSFSVSPTQGAQGAFDSFGTPNHKFDQPRNPFGDSSPTDLPGYEMKSETYELRDFDAILPDSARRLTRQSPTRQDSARGGWTPDLSFRSSPRPILSYPTSRAGSPPPRGELPLMTFRCQTTKPQCGIFLLGEIYQPTQSAIQTVQLYIPVA